MLYDAYVAQSDFMAPFQALADAASDAFGDTQLGPAANYFFKGLAAGAEIASRAHLNHERPDYDILEAEVEGRIVPVFEEVALDTPFGNLLH
jgi:poly(3-hydroxybutyrate) depolymerase